ncbi:MAG: pyruvate, phosphate dikinase [Deltaproteobacteria bacterium]|nr:pyruvate, phosphate dikinase [Deltaproteobacteria bacterium]
MSTQWVYSFGEGQADGDATKRALLGGKGANLAEMTRLGLPVPPGFTITTEACRAFWAHGERLTDEIRAQVEDARRLLERRMGQALGDPQGGLLVSVRSGAAVSMPGMMDTVLNLGLNDVTVEALARRTGNPRFAWDSYRRLLHMYSNVVMGLHGDHLEDLLVRMKEREDLHSDASLTAETLEELVGIFKDQIFEQAGQPFPQDATTQLWAAIDAVFRSWNTRRAVDYRNANQIPHDLGTAVTVQAMVFGNMGQTSATGVAFTRNPNTGERMFFGEWLPNAQGEDGVAGIRTPLPINVESGAESPDETLEHQQPEAYADLLRVKDLLERHYRDMQDIEFTVQEGRLFVLQTRGGKRSPAAEVRIAAELVDEGLVTQAEAVKRVRTETLEKLMHPRIDPTAPRVVIAQGLGASPGAATGRVCFHAQDAVERAGRGEDVILVRRETSPEDIHGMLKARGVLTARGGMTSHAAVVARGMSKPCIVGCRDIEVAPDARLFRARGGQIIKDGDLVTIDGAEGTVMLGAVATIQPKPSPELERIMTWADGIRTLRIRTNADTARECLAARERGAEGVGLCRTEHMFFEEGRITAVREMILADSEEGRRNALAALLPMQRGDFVAIFRVMRDLPVTVRLLDPPLHEFLTENAGDIESMARHLGLPVDRVQERYRSLHEVNPMLGHRGCRLGLTFPEIYEMQVRAIIEAACELAADGIVVEPEIMIPLVGHVRELETMRELVRSTAERVQVEQGRDVAYKIGTMIELPRACLTADQIAGAADFFSFGTNDLTQTTFGISRDDCGRFLPLYIEMGILPGDPFVAIDPAVGELVRMGTEKGRSVKADLKVGICGEHGGEPTSIHFCHAIGLDYVSCSPFRVPVARLAAAHAALAQPKKAVA